MSEICIQLTIASKLMEALYLLKNFAVRLGIKLFRRAFTLVIKFYKDMASLISTQETRAKHM